MNFQFEKSVPIEPKTGQFLEGKCCQILPLDGFDGLGVRHVSELVLAPHLKLVARVTLLGTIDPLGGGERGAGILQTSALRFYYTTPNDSKNRSSCFMVTVLFFIDVVCGLMRCSIRRMRFCLRNTETLRWFITLRT